MAELTLAYQVRSYSTGTVGRAICNVRNHAYVADGSGGEMVGAGGTFPFRHLRMRRQHGGRDRQERKHRSGLMDVSVSSYRDADANHGDLSLYDGIRVNFEMWGVDDDQAHELVETWKRR